MLYFLNMNDMFITFFKAAISMKNMIVVKLMGGLGNQMFQYACGRALAEKYNSKLALDLSWFDNQLLRKYELDQWNIINVKILSKNEAKNIHSLEDFVLKFSYKSIWHWLYNSFFYPNLSFIKEIKTGWFQEIDMRSTRNIYLKGYWQSEKYFQDIKPIIQYEFSKADHLSHAAKKVLDDINNLDNTVSIHIRRGDYISNEKTNKVHYICDPSYYDRAIHFLEQKHIQISKVFIFTDDPHWCKENFKVSYQSEIVSGNNFDASTDINLMSNCHHNIIANSSFSWWGAWLNKNPHKIVIAPQKWFTTKDVNDIICQSWYKI